MIELTDEQIITTYKNTNKYSHEDCFDVEDAHGFLLELVNSLTLPQLKQRAQQHNASVVQWVKFNSDDKSTWPEETSSILGLDMDNDVSIYKYYSLHGRSFFYKHKITHWAYLPIPKVK